jgi:hypothetical protein
MQPIHFLVLALVTALIYSLFRIGVKAVTKDRLYQFAEGKAAGRIEGRAERVSEHNALQMADLHTLLEISNTLHVAHKTWRAIPHTEKYRAQATQHLNDLNKIAKRIRDQGEDGSGTAEQEKAA